jgi:23S rRNA pseudouridine2457 synthase|tara:strand:- start:1642 stop:2247 length:606 start_codon:yes stop_codon:yes gene_type:complete
MQVYWIKLLEIGCFNGAADRRYPISRIVLFNKPFDVLSQFTDKNRRTTLKGYIDIPDVQVSGRLDRDSEGLLMLTDSGALQHKITQPKHKVSKTYWVQVEGAPQESDLQSLREGIALKDGITLPAKVTLMDEPDNLWARNPPIRERKSIPDTWLNMTISEGRNRQVRRMCAAAGFPVLRLIRYRIGSWTLDGIEPGQYNEL